MHEIWIKDLRHWAEVVAQLAKRSAVRIQSYIKHFFTQNCIEKTKVEKRGREWPNFKI